MIRKVIRTDGTEQQLDHTPSITEVHKLIGADCLDTFTLNDGVHVVFVDDLGYDKGLPVNPAATKLYLARCKPGTTHQILGDIVIVPDRDYA